MRLLFFSSDRLGIPLLKALKEDERFEVLGVFCQPDRPFGRDKELKKAPAKLIAEEWGLPCYQPESLREADELLAQFTENPPDLLITLSYGQILPKKWLDLPKKFPINIHPSLLPKYRGPAPIHAAILNQDAKTGISLMKMLQKMDAGPLADQMTIEIPENIHLHELEDILVNLAAKWVPEKLLTLRENDFTPQEGLPSYTHKFTREEGFIDFNEPSASIHAKFRAFHPWPGLWTWMNGKRLKLLALAPSTLKMDAGTTLIQDERLFVGCTGGSVEISLLQMEGSSPQNVKEFLMGKKIGESLGHTNNVS